MIFYQLIVIGYIIYILGVSVLTIYVNDNCMNVKKQVHL